MTDRRATRTARSRLSVLIATVLALLAVAVPASAQVAIEGSPLRVVAGEAGNTQARLADRPSGLFFPPSSDLGNAGLFLGFPSGAAGFPSSLDGQAFGPTGSFGAAVTPYTPVSQGPVSGTGTVADPFTQVSVFDAVDGTVPSQGRIVARIAQTLTYVNGESRFRATYAIVNPDPELPLRFRAAAAADLFVEGSDSGPGLFFPGPPRFVGGLNDLTGRGGGLQEVAGSEWSAYQAAELSTIWSAVESPNGTGFDNSAVATSVDNAVGVQWDANLAVASGLRPLQSVAYSVVWIAAATTPLTLAPSEAGAFVGQTHQTTVQSRTPEGGLLSGETVRFTVAGVNAPQSGVVTTNADGQAVISIIGTSEGRDTITAYADRNGDGVRQEAEPSATANVTWFPPLPRLPPPPPPPPPPSPPPPPALGGVVARELAPASAAPGEIVRIVGSGFGAGQGAGEVRFGGASAGLAPVWRDERIEVLVPSVAPGPTTVQIAVPGEPPVSLAFTVAPPAPEPPIANVVAIPVAPGTFIFDASLSIDPASLGQPAPSLAEGQSREKVLGPGLRSVLWRFGDGTSSRQTVVRKSFSRPGPTPVSLTVTSSSGRTDTFRQSVSVPRRRAIPPPPPPVNIQIPARVVFDVGSAVLREQSRAYLGDLSRLVRQIGRPTEVEGHTDNQGSAGYLQDLSEARAREVRRYLAEEGRVPGSLLAAAGFGASQPISSNGTLLGRQMNRRVVLDIARQGQGLRLTPSQLRINQRISQAALRRERAILARLEQGLTARDIRDGSLGRGAFAEAIQIAGQETPVAAGPSRARAIGVPARQGTPGRVRLVAGQLLINQRISQTAVRRVNALEARLDAGLTGRDIRDGALGARALAAGLSVNAAGPGPLAAPFRTPATPPRRRGDASGVSLSIAQLRINQRISQAAIRRLNAIRERFEAGFTGGDFRPGSITQENLEPGLR